MSGNLSMLRRALLLSCVAAILISPVCVRAAITTTTAHALEPAFAQKAFRPYGYYSLVGKAPKGFENFDTIQYWRRDQEQRGPDISERTAGVNVSGGVVYRYATISVTRQRFVFTTGKVRGVSYSFNGRFIRTDFVNQELDFNKPVLTGILVKYRNGRRVATANVTLNYFAGT
jgi:hypothetical protein